MTTSTRQPHTEDDALQVLLDADIDKVMSGLDRIVEAAPSYRKLFSRWEKQQWNSESFDFAEDRRQWDGGVFDAEQRAFIEWSLSSFFLGEERVTTELLPFAIAAPSMDARAFLATQIADEARHVAFFDRFYAEVGVLESDELEGRLAELPPDREVVAYCRGPLCAYAHDAVRRLRTAGREARRLEEGWPEWRLADRPREAIA